MLIHDLDSDDCARLLTRTSLGHLACAKDGQPYVVPIHFSFDPERRCIYSLSTVGQKIRWMRGNPRVSLAVEDIADKDYWQTVIVSGTYEELGDTPEHAEARERCRQLFCERTEWWFPATAQRHARDLRAVVLYRIRIERMTGREAARNVLAEPPSHSTRGAHDV